jgi:hypothetical protein
MPQRHLQFCNKLNTLEDVVVVGPVEKLKLGLRLVTVAPGGRLSSSKCHHRRSYAFQHASPAPPPSSPPHSLFDSPFSTFAQEAPIFHSSFHGWTPHPAWSQKRRNFI